MSLKGFLIHEKSALSFRRGCNSNCSGSFGSSLLLDRLTLDTSTSYSEETLTFRASAGAETAPSAKGSTWVLLFPPARALTMAAGWEGSFSSSPNIDERMRWIAERALLSFSSTTFGDTMEGLLSMFEGLLRAPATPARAPFAGTASRRIAADCKPESRRGPAPRPAPPPGTARASLARTAFLLVSLPCFLAALSRRACDSAIPLEDLDSLSPSLLETSDSLDSLLLSSGSALSSTSHVASFFSSSSTPPNSLPLRRIVDNFETTFLSFWMGFVSDPTTNVLSAFR
mmetsp:Transcript_85716/g.154328  ORF Transcript_85716/g.154328 Transcript_85716/m.154328 type:complete len:286 (+) Transcript_85716:1508-2365(+)